MLVGPHLARLSPRVWGRPRPCSRRRVLFSFIGQHIPKRLFVRIRTYQSGSTYTRNIVGKQVDLCPSEIKVGGSNPEWRLFFVCVPFSLSFDGAMYFITSIKIYTMTIEVSSGQSRSQFYMHTACCCFLLLVFIIVYQMIKFVAGSLNFDPGVLFLFIQPRFIFNVPLGSTVAFTASIYLDPQ